MPDRLQELLSERTDQYALAVTYYQLRTGQLPFPDGPTVFDRLLAGNTVGSLAVLLLAVVGFLTGRPEWLDIAIVYGLLNLIGTLAALKFFRHGDLAHDVEDDT